MVNVSILEWTLGDVTVQLRHRVPYTSVADPDPGLGTFLTPGSRIRDGDSSDPGWKKVGSGISIPDPPHCHTPCFSLDSASGSKTASWDPSQLEWTRHPIPLMKTLRSSKTAGVYSNSWGHLLTPYRAAVHFHLPRDPQTKTHFAASGTISAQHPCVRIY